LKVIEHAQTFGWKSAVSAFGVGKSTLYRWKAAYANGHHQLKSLIPSSTRPHRVRLMHTSAKLLSFIAAFRGHYGNKSKYVIKPFLDEYAQSLGIPSLGYSTIGKIIKRNRWFSPPRKQWSKKRFAAYQRVKYAPKEQMPGYVEVDCVHLWCTDRRYVFVSVIDVVTKVASVQLVPAATAHHTLTVLQAFGARGYPIRCVQTDNGSEFLVVFHAWLSTQAIDHHFIYPHSPRINGVVERFNRTIQEECLNRSDDLFTDNLDRFQQTLDHYLIWYNTKRPHHSLKLMAPMAYYQQLQSFPKCT
jgi:transposase InsO family protein